MTARQLSKFIHTGKYANHIAEEKRRETKVESGDRMMAMHAAFYGDRGQEVLGAIEEARGAFHDGLVLGSQRALQYGGKPILKKNARNFNCFHKKTEFVTSKGVKSFSDFNNGDNVLVMTHTGAWKKAVVRNHGLQEMNDVVIKRGNAEHTVCVTGDHRWLLRNGEETNFLGEGDALLASPRTFSNFEYENADVDERVWWAYGFVYGDGTCVKNKNGDYKNSMVRLCGHKRRFLERFLELGFSHSYPPSADGDPFVYTGKYLKTLPSTEDAPLRVIQAFVAGYLDADGTRNKNSDSPSPFTNIQSSDDEAADFIRKAFPVAGVFIVSETEINHETNYGTHDATGFRLTQGQGKTAHAFRVNSITKTGEHEAWCLEVEDDHSFVLPFGLPTGNCTVSYADRPRFFAEAFWLLLCGCGTGFSVQKHHVDKLPGISAPKKEWDLFNIPDTIEGWADALDALLDSYFTPEHNRITFDYSLIRVEGSKLSSTTAGRAPGPEPLRHSLELIRKMLDRCVADGQKTLRPIDAYDIVMHTSDAVLSGGVRRSASICIFSADDDDMARAKTGAWQKDNAQRGRSNNSALLLRGETPRERFDWLVECAQTSGDPGFIWSDSTEFVSNPCVEISMMPVDTVTGETGWQMCNLSTINMEACETREEALKAARAAAILGTLQAGYTTFSYLGEVSERITRDEALLGVSMTGMMRNPEVSFDSGLLKEMAEVVKDTNAWLAGLIGINVAARTTCLKPEGTGSLLLETSSGITPDHAHRYIRRVAGTSNESHLKFFETMNPEAVEINSWDRSGTGKLVNFCIEAPEHALVKDQVSAVELLERVKLVKQSWVDTGKRPELCRHQSLSHNVSNTIHVKDGEWDDVADFIFENQHSFAGVALLSSFGDLDIRQAPNTRVKTSHEIMSEYGDGAILASKYALDAEEIFDDLWVACDTALGCPMGIGIDFKEGPTEDERLKAQYLWTLDFNQFARIYFPGNMRRATHCLKDVYLLGRWNSLRDSTVDVDFTLMTEEEDGTNLEGTIACAGGSCEVSF